MERGKKYKMSEVWGELKVGMRIVTNGDAIGIVAQDFIGTVIHVSEMTLQVKREGRGHPWVIHKDSPCHVGLGPSDEEVEEEARKQREEEGKRLRREKEERRQMFDSIVLPREIKDSVLQTLTQMEPDKQDKIFRKWGLGDILEKGRGMAMLFYGVPGTGKTLMGEAVAPCVTLAEMAKMAKIRIAGGTIKNIALNAAKRAAFLGKEQIEMEDLVFAKENERRGALAFQRGREGHARLAKKYREIGR